MGGSNKNMKCFLLFVVASVVSAEECCQKKSVGEITYVHVENNFVSTREAGCKDGCIYERTDDRNGVRYCFKEGNQLSECLPLGVGCPCGRGPSCGTADCCGCTTGCTTAPCPSPPLTTTVDP